MVTGYQAPRSTVLHRPLDSTIGTTTFARTFCGIDLPGDDTWNKAEGEAYTCRPCATAYAAVQRRRAPWAAGERQVYRKRRHPGLLYYLAERGDFGPNQPTGGASWRLLATPRPSFRTSRDARAPEDRPWRLCVGDDFGRCVGHFKTTHEAVDFTKQVEAAGLLVQMLKQVDTDTWDERTSALTFLASHTPKETNPA